MTENTNVFESKMSMTAIRMPTLWRTYTGALPAPTLSHGLPAAFADATALGPPVVQMKSTPGWWNRYCDTSSDGSGITWSECGGSPAASPACCRSSAARAAQRASAADGRMISALRVFAHTIDLNSVVEVGLVIGNSA